ncbi:putative transmembrane anchored protein [Clostridium sporogenes]|uniref:hypothetical protein n=1 Tax=Clostridium TaxID=1485 RepID=UPI0005F99FF8|nr:MULTISPECIES: hypothetical protein [Clostridium]APF26097.1 putative transmembrane anchored protein [Clostridium sporogenes]MDI6918262.1 hypothetical protein [Clostridium botulinum]WMU98340.1 hypothetical protein QA656_03455 [Clostridium botulinum]
MKKFLMLVFAILLAVPTLTGCSMRINNYENKLYSEKDINKNIKVGSIQDNILTREKAMAKALDIFDKGFNIKLNRENLNESVRIIRRPEKDILYWNITWTSINTKKMYNCVIDTSNGKIKSISLYNPNEENKGEKVEHILKEKDILSVVNPLFKALKINPNNYHINDGGIAYGYMVQNQVFNFKNKRDDKEDITIIVNCNNKAITSFFINTYEN